MSEFDPKMLRSPRETLGGYIILPRLIDKIRLHKQGKLPPEYVGNLCKPGLVDARFLEFIGISADEMRKAALSLKSDAEILAWVEQHAVRHSETEKKKWAEQFLVYRPPPEIVQLRKKLYPELDKKIDLAAISISDMIDMDEGRIPFPVK